MIDPVDLLMAQDPTTPPEELERLYWVYFFGGDAGWVGHHDICRLIAVNPNISRAFLAKCASHAVDISTNPLIPVLLLECPDWVRRYIPQHYLTPEE